MRYEERIGSVRLAVEPQASGFPVVRIGVLRENTKELTLSEAAGLANDLRLAIEIATPLMTKEFHPVKQQWSGW